MKKVLVLLGVVIVAVLTITPRLVGWVIQDANTEAQLVALTQQPGLNLEMESGWFSSRGQLTIPDPMIAGNIYHGVVLKADLEIMHGPLLVTDDGMELGIAWANVLPVISGLAADYPLQQLLARDMNTTFTLFAGLNGSLRLNMDAGALEFSDNSRRLYLDDLQSELRIAASGSAELSATSSEITLIDPLNELVLRDTATRLHSTNISAAPLPGGLNIQASQMQISQPQRLTLNGIELDYVARQEADTRTITLQQLVQIEEIVSALPVESVTLTTELTGIDEAVTTDYIAFIREAQGQLQSMTEEQLQNYAAQHGEQLALELLRHPLRQVSNMTVQAYGGEHQAELIMAWPGVPDLRTLTDLDFRTVLRQLDMTLEMVANEEALSRSPLAASVRAYVMQGVLPQQGGNVLLDARLEDSVIVVNGQSLPLEPFLRM